MVILCSEFFERPTIHTRRRLKHNTNPNCGLDMFCLHREIANDVAAVFGSEESLSSLLPRPDHSITTLHSLSAPIACLSVAVRLGRMLAARKACQERAGDRRATTEKSRRRAAANDRGYNARIGIRLGVRAIGNGQSVIKRTCPPSRDRRYCCSRGLPRNPADLRQRIQLREQTWLLSMHKASG